MRRGNFGNGRNVTLHSLAYFGLVTSDNNVYSLWKINFMEKRIIERLNAPLYLMCKINCKSHVSFHTKTKEFWRELDF